MKLKALLLLLTGLTSVSACGFQDPMAFHLELEMNQMARQIGEALDDRYAVEIVVEDRQGLTWHECQSEHNRIVFDKSTLFEFDSTAGSVDQAWPALLQDLGACAYGLEPVAWDPEFYPTCDTVPEASQPPTAMAEELTEAESLCISTQKDLYIRELEERIHDWRLAQLSHLRRSSWDP